MLCFVFRNSAHFKGNEFKNTDNIANSRYKVQTILVIFQRFCVIKNDFYLKLFM